MGAADQAPVQTPENAASSETSALAMQSQRDVEAILNARAKANEQDNVIASDENHSGPAAKTIVWNQPQRSSSPNSSITPAKNDVRQPPLARPASPELNLPAQSESETPSKPADAKLQPDRLNKLMVDLSRELYSSGAYSQVPLRELLMIAAMSMVDPARRLDPQAIPDLTEKERELLGKLQTFFAELGKSLDGKTDTEDAIVDAVAALREQLVKQPTLQLPTASLCTRVGGFGDYAPFERFSFLAQSEQKVIVYLEIDDFTSEANQKGEFVTQLAQQLTIYSDRDGIPVWKEDWQSAVDVSKNKRHDFFTVQVITLPKALSVGKYQLKVRVRDEKSSAEAEASIPFEMVADPKMAAGVPRTK